MEIDVYDIALENGSKLKDRYLIEQVYYWGHTSILYLATDTLTKERVAVKEFCPYFYANRDMDGKTVICKGKRYERAYKNAYRAFMQECEIVKKLQDLKETREGYILRYQDDFQENETIYLVTEFIEGTSLDEVVENEMDFPFRECVSRLIKLVRAIHKIGIYHRDIKPANIIFRKSGSIVLIDFGSACYKEKQNTELVFVSRGYSAPELYSRMPSGEETDVYSIGALLYYLLSRRQMPGADERMKQEEMEPLEDLVEVPKSISYMINKAVTLEPEKRLKSLWLLEKLMEKQ
ncbi:MAG: serine/threonine protein kinase [Lachnospiraceae bacterium]|nr:serine/threonine protein kinase [Lachnospiraceae bacterium]